MSSKERFEQCMLSNPNTGRFQTNSKGSVLEGTTSGWSTALSKFQVIPDQPIPFTMRNICSAWANNDQKMIPTDISFSKLYYERPPVHLRFSRDPLTVHPPRPAAAFEFSPFEYE